MVLPSPQVQDTSPMRIVCPGLDPSFSFSYFAVRFLAEGNWDLLMCEMPVWLGGHGSLRQCV